MAHFTKRIQSDKTFLNFYFNRIFTASGERYHVSVVGSDKKVHSFNMELFNGRWQLSDAYTCPQWLAQLESELAAAIMEQ